MTTRDQQPASSALGRLWDVAVVGAGPAGVMAAIRLAGQGHGVVLIDRHRFPREKVCGGGISACTIKRLKGAGAYESVLSAGHRLSLSSVFSPSLVEVQVRSEFITMRRKDLDSILAGRAAESGALFCHGRVEGVESFPSEVVITISGSKERIRARYCLLATGADIALARRLGMIAEPRPSAVAVRCHVRSRHPLDRLVGFYDRDLAPGYGWIFPMGGGEFNVGIILFHGVHRKGCVNLRQAFETFKERFPVAREVFGSGGEISPLEGGTLRCGLEGCRTWGKGRVLLAGEVTGTTLPFTGEGIGQAMEGGSIAADAFGEALRTGSPIDLERYAGTVGRRLGARHKGHAVAQRWLSSPYLNDFMAKRIVRSRRLQDSLTRVVADGGDPREVFSLRGVLGSIVG